MMFHILEFVTHTSPKLHLFLEADDAFGSHFHVLVEVVEHTAGDPDEEGTVALLADGLRLVDGGSKPYGLVIDRSIEDPGSQNVAFVDAHGEVDVPHAFDGLAQAYADEFGGFDGDIDDVGDLVDFLGIDEQEAFGGVAVEIAPGFLAHGAEDVIINLVEPCGESFTGLEQKGDVLDMEIQHGGFHDDAAAVVVQTGDCFEVAGAREGEFLLG